MSDFNKEILDYYNKGNEKGRLNLGSNQLEKVRTLDILNRYIPKSANVVVDVGGGAGVYSFILSEQDFVVHLVDAVPLHIDQAKEVNKTQSHPLKSISVGDARNLEFEDSSTDVVLLLGPMYHLTDKKDRIKALSEAYRILKPNGMLFTAGISKFASLIDGFDRKFILNEDFRTIVNEDLKSSQHRNPSNKEHYFTTAFFHNPNELLIEHIDAGFNSLELLSVETMLGLLGNITEYLNNESELNILLDFARKIEKETSMIGASSHILVIATKE